MQIKKTETRWKTFYKFGLRSLINKRIIRQSYDSLRSSGAGSLLAIYFHRPINSVFVILASSDFSNEGYGYPKFRFFRQKSSIAIQFQHSV